jgi:hypothetical protein
MANDTKEQNERYREAARKIVAGTAVTIQAVATVWPTEDGAFVEAVVWVAKGQL